MTICAQTAISYSALIILHSPSFLERDISVQPITMEMRINLERRKAPVSLSNARDYPSVAFLRFVGFGAPSILALDLSS